MPEEKYVVVIENVAGVLPKWGSHAHISMANAETPEEAITKVVTRAMSPKWARGLFTPIEEGDSPRLREIPPHTNLEGVVSYSDGNCNSMEEWVYTAVKVGPA